MNTFSTLMLKIIKHPKKHVLSMFEFVHNNKIPFLFQIN